MLTTLLRPLGMLPGLALFLLVLGAAQPARATHLLGGEMTYRYLDNNGPAAAPLRYEITVTVYNNCGSLGITAPRPSASVGIYNQTTGAQVVLTAVNYPYTSSFVGQPGIMSIPQTSLSECIAPAIPPGCSITGASQPYVLQKFTGVVNLPNTSSGYFALFTDGSRNVDVTNLYDPGSQAMTLYVALAPPKIPNHSPVFSDIAVAIICANDTTYLLNNAVDADGDRLVYSFGQPYATKDGLAILPDYFTPPPLLADYNAGSGYSGATPFGNAAGNFAFLDPSTGLARYGAATAGRKYAVAVDVKEYRTIAGQEVLIGTTRRDLQLVVANCPATKAPVLPPVTITPRNYTIEAGSTLSVPITATQADAHPLEMTLNSVLLDGVGGYNASLDGNPGTVTLGSPTGRATVTGANGVVTGTFVFAAGCDAARATPYDVAFTVKDNGCAGKTVADVLHITVTKPKGPTAISGDPLVCELNAVRAYAASGGTAPQVSWRVVGGTIIGSPTANPVQVQWGGVGTGTVVARGLTQYDCLTDSVTQRVTVGQHVTLAVAGTLKLCQGSSTTLVVSGGTTPYTVTGGPAILTGAGPFTISPTSTTTYSIVGAPAPNSCGASAQVTVTVLPAPAASVGAPVRTSCSGETLSLGAAPVGGNTYSWSPAAGLSSTAIANPTLTLVNTGTAALTQVYTLTETSAAGCQASNSVTVTINPRPVALAGTAVTVCSGGSAQLGAPAVAGYAYSWSPATGLSSATAANPTVTLPNPASAPLTQTYTLTVTNAATACTATATVTVTVTPLPIAAPGTAVTVCSGGSAQLGAPAVAGYTYSWSPATGLSSATAANPTVTLPNPASAPLTQTYTLTVTNAATTCVGTGTVAVTVNPVLTPGAISASQTVCAGTIPAPFASTAGASGGDGTFSYQWESSPDNATWTAIAGATSLTYAPGAATASTYYRRQAATPTCGTAYSNVVAVQVQAPLVTAVALATPPAQCAGTAFSFSPVPTNAGAAPTYRWYVNNALVAASPTFSSSTLADGDQVKVELTPTAGFCASGPAVAAVTVRLTPVAPPAVTMTLQTALPVCPGVPITFSLDKATNPGPSPQYQWQVDGVDVAGAQSPVFTSTKLRDGQTVTLVLRAATACGPVTATASGVRVSISPAADVDAGPDKTIMEGEQVELEGKASGTYPVTWTPLLGLTFVNGTTLRPLAAPSVTTTYTLSAGLGNCADSSPVTVTVTPRLRIPSAISPNGDGENDTWEIDHSGDYPGNHVLVFNRWGNKIFETSGYSRTNEWNGTIGGQPVPIGTYYYVITLGNGKSYSGPITVVY